MRSRILEAARDLFVSEGYEAVTLRKVADAIEYCPATIYKYFQDKDEMVRALCEEDIAQLLGLFRSVSADRAPLERLSEFGKAYIRMGLERPNHYRLMFMTPLLDPDSSLMEEKLANPDNDSYRLFRTIVEQCIAADVFKPELDDAELIAQTLWSGLHGVISLHIAMGTHPFVDWRPVESRARFIHDLMIRGMLRDGVHYQGMSPLAAALDTTPA